MSAPIQGIQNKVVQYALKGKLAVLPSFSASRHLGIFNCAAINNSGGAITVGLLRLANLGLVKLYKLVAGVYTQLSLDDLAGGLEVMTGDDADGFAVGYISPLGLLGLTVSANDTGSLLFQYSNDGANFVDLPAGSPIEVPADFNTASDNYIVATPPLDQVTGGDPGLDPNLYYLQVIADGALGGAIEIDNLWAGSFLSVFQGISNGQGVSISFDWKRPLFLEGGENIIPYFGTAADANRVSIFYNANG